MTRSPLEDTILLMNDKSFVILVSRIVSLNLPHVSVTRYYVRTLEKLVLVSSTKLVLMFSKCEQRISQFENHLNFSKFDVLFYFLKTIFKNMTAVIFLITDVKHKRKQSHENYLLYVVRENIFN